MLTRITTIACITALLIAVSWHSFPEYRVPFSLVIWAGAIVVSVQAVRTARFSWMLVFLGIAGVFNPIMPGGLSRGVFYALELATLGLFAVSLAVFSREPNLSGAGLAARDAGRNRF